MFDKKEWVGRKFLCLNTGQTLEIDDSVRPKQFLPFGDCFVGVGDGYYSRAGGNFKEISTHKYSIEKLIHYQCGKCKQWWTIGDGMEEGELCCPACGYKSNLEKI